MRINEKLDQRKNSSKKEIQRINWNIVVRIMHILHRNYEIKKSHIATKGRLGYDKCRLYLEWMEMMDLIEKKKNNDGFETIILSDRGLSLYNNKIKI